MPLPRFRHFILATLLLAALRPAPLRAQTPPVYLVFFTHIEDNTPAGTLGTPASRANYILMRDRLLAMADLARAHDIPWTLQSDWKYLRAALLYEDASLTNTTNGKNLFRYLKEDRGVFLDPHSHENSGYDYTDVAHLMDSLGVGGSTIIGGHIWDPDLPQFQAWDRFRTTQPGETYPWASWRGDVLMGSGSPNHIDDPLVSGVWRPRDRDHYFEDDPAANIVAIGGYKGSLDDIPELRALYDSGQVDPQYMLTTTYSIKPSLLTAVGGLQGIEDSLLVPAAAYRDAGLCLPTDFTSLVATWRNDFGARGFTYDARAISAVGTTPGPPPTLAITGVTPNPCAGRTTIAFSVAAAAPALLEIFDARGRRVARLVDTIVSPGAHALDWDAAGVASGAYFIRLATPDAGAPAATTRKILILR